MGTILTIIWALLGPPEVCNSTIFGYPGDKWAGGNALLYKRPIRPGDIGIAHRTLPLGSWVVVQHMNNGRVAFGRVVDRGPYGAIHAGSWVLKRRAHEPGTWRSCADLTPDMATLLDHDGFDWVRVWSL